MASRSQKIFLRAVLDTSSRHPNNPCLLVVHIVLHHLLCRILRLAVIAVGLL
jgi:hypothetical protein